jgi:hypothetical protein
MTMMATTITTMDPPTHTPHPRRHNFGLDPSRSGWPAVC